MSNFVAIICVGVLTFIVTLLVYFARKNEWTKFREWWNAEGVPIYMLAFIVVGALAISRGCLR
jgi:Na+/proline symporter